MSVRIPLDPKKFDDVLGAMTGLNRAIESAGLDKKLLYLVEVRVSQINGCGFCLEMHTKDARRNGETEQRHTKPAA
jgi:AhpD family alkylhydroperoxidase